MMKLKVLLISAIWSIFFPLFCFADFNGAVSAYEKGDFKKALSLFRELAQNGDTSAQFNLGCMYQNGQGTEQNFQEALKWYRQAEKNGHKKSSENIQAIEEVLAEQKKDSKKWYITPEELAKRQALKAQKGQEEKERREAEEKLEAEKQQEKENEWKAKKDQIQLETAKEEDRKKATDLRAFMIGLSEGADPLIYRGHSLSIPCYEIAFPEYSSYYERMVASEHKRALLYTTKNNFYKGKEFAIKAIMVETRKMKLTKEAGGLTPDWAVYLEMEPIK